MHRYYALHQIHVVLILTIETHNISNRYFVFVMMQQADRVSGSNLSLLEPGSLRTSPTVIPSPYSNSTLHWVFKNSSLDNLTVQEQLSWLSNVDRYHLHLRC